MHPKVKYLNTLIEADHGKLNMNSDWLSLLRVREYRETQARAKLSDCRAQHELSKRRVRQRQQALRRYRAWLPGQEARLFTQLQAEPANSRTVENYQATLKGLRTEEDNLQSQLQQARAATAEAQTLMKHAEAQWHAALKAKEKLVELTAKHQQVARRQAEYSEEMDLEEAALLGYTERQ